MFGLVIIILKGIRELFYYKKKNFNEIMVFFI